MANNYGLVYTADQAKQQLLNMNRDYNNRLIWQNMFNENTLTAQRAENQLTYKVKMLLEIVKSLVKVNNNY